MKSNEKIANAKKRISELEELIKCWNNQKNNESNLALDNTKLEKV